MDFFLGKKFLEVYSACQAVLLVKQIPAFCYAQLFPPPNYLEIIARKEVELNALGTVQDLAEH